jgi:hypothetical protein
LFYIFSGYTEISAAAAAAAVAAMHATQKKIFRFTHNYVSKTKYLLYIM